ncbi:MAG: site-2 protease family protein [Bacilli bacterium]|nr:site-2 protease family protein [Bacilli bacterium]
MKTLFKINIFTYLFFLLSMLSGYFKEISIAYIILIIHELGHFFLMKYYDINVDNITLYPYGGMIKSNMLINTNSLRVLIISLGGILSQVLLYIVMFFLYKFYVIDFNIFSLFIKYNLYIIIFNLLPIYPLDGFKILSSILELIFNFKLSIKISFIINIIFLVLFIIYLYLLKINNYMIVIFLLCSLFNYLKEIKYIINKFYIERIIYDLKYNGLISVNSISNMYKNKFNYINGINEDEYLEKSYKIG